MLGGEQAIQIAWQLRRRVESHWQSKGDRLPIILTEEDQQELMAGAEDETFWLGATNQEYEGFTPVLGLHLCWWRVCYQRGLTRLVFISWYG